MKCFIPQKFYDGDRFDPKKMNENALALQASLQAVLAQRYSHFQFVLDFGPYASTDAAGEAQRSIYAPFAYEIIDSQLFVVDSSDQTVTLACSDSNWNDVSVAVDTTASYSFKNQIQNMKVAADTQVDFTMAVPSADIDRVYAIVKCRYDAFVGLTVPTLPQVASGESVSATEWNTYFSAVETLVGNLETNWPKRKGIEVHTWRNVINTDVALYSSPFTTSVSSTTRTYLNGGTRDILKLSVGYYSTDLGSVTAVGAQLYDEDVPQVMINYAIAADENDTEFGQASGVSNASTTSDSSAADLRLAPYTLGSTLNALETFYVVLYWEQ